MSAVVHALPLNHHRKFVREWAAQMALLGPDGAENFLIEHLEVEWDRLEAIGVDCDAVERNIHELATALWSAAFGRGPSNSDDVLPANSGSVASFPYSRRRQFVAQHAHVMRGMSEDESEAYLTDVLEGVCKDVGEMGIDGEASNLIFDLADAIGKELHGPSFTLMIEGTAK